MCTTKHFNPGWAPVSPDGVVKWFLADYRRRAVIDGVINMTLSWDNETSFPLEYTWRQLRRQGWRVVRCKVAEEGT